MNDGNITFFKTYSYFGYLWFVYRESSSANIGISEAPLQRCSQEKELCNFVEIKFRHGYSPVNLLYIFRTPFAKNT